MTNALGRGLTALALVGLSVSAVAGQKYQVRVIDRQDNSSSYTYAVPGYSNSSTTGSANCTAYTYSAYCSGSATTTTTGTPGYVGSYEVRGATLSLQLPDGRIAIVNCNSKLNWTDWSQGAVRSCRTPFVNTIEAEFDGDKAKLKWSVSIDGKKTQSETYKIVAVLDPPTPTQTTRTSPVSEPPTPTSTSSYTAADMVAAEAAFRARHNVTPEIEKQIVDLGNSGRIAPGSNQTPADYLDTLYEIATARPSIWKEGADGSRRQLRSNKDRMYVEVLMPPDQAHFWQSSADLRRQGEAWVGEWRATAVCNREGKRCNIGPLPFVISTVSPHQTEGWYEQPDPTLGYDCDSCRVRATVRHDFVWVPEGGTVASSGN